MKVKGKHTRSIWPDGNDRRVHIVDQTRLPFAFETRTLGNLAEVALAIRSMQVRGAPLIGVTAAFGIALAMRQDASDNALADAIRTLAATRPTAVNLAWALAVMQRHLSPLAPGKRADAAWQHAEKMANDDVATNEAIGNHGLTLIAAFHEKLKRPINIHAAVNRASPA